MKKTNKFFIELLLSLIILSTTQSCATFGKRPTYQSNAIIVKERNTPTVVENGKQKLSYTGESFFRTISYISTDSIYFEVEMFPKEFEYSLGPPYVPIIPNIFYPIIYFGIDNKTSVHNIIISQSDIISVSDLKFYRNKKEITPKTVSILDAVTNSARNVTYTIIDTDVMNLHPQKYYLFTFELKKITTKEIEIRNKGKCIFYIKRKMKFHYDPFGIYFS